MFSEQDVLHIIYRNGLCLREDLNILRILRLYLTFACFSTKQKETSRVRLHFLAFRENRRMNFGYFWLGTIYYPNKSVQSFLCPHVSNTIWILAIEISLIVFQTTTSFRIYYWIIFQILIIYLISLFHDIWTLRLFSFSL